MMNDLKCNKTIADYLIAADPVMKKIINGNYDIQRESATDYFISLVRAIVSQQISGKVAQVIFRRIEDLCGSITVQSIDRLTDDELRLCGLSFAKISYIRSLCECVDNKSVDLDNIDQLTDTEVLRSLEQIKGIGNWSANMFLIFALKREDVFCIKDGALCKAISHYYFNDKVIDQKKINKIVNKWSPYKTYASLYLWESIKK